MRCDPGLEFRDAERLANVVEGAQLEGADNRGVVVDGREQEYRKGDFCRSPAMEDVETEHSRHQLIEDREVDLSGFPRFVGGVPVLCLDHFVAIGFEMPPEEQAHGRRVVGDEDACHPSAVCHHFSVIGAFSRLPPHERRRLAALGRSDLDALARRRLDGEPLQYIEGSAAFTDFDVLVDSRVLVPRPETEGLFELAASAVAAPRVVVDLGTGSGVLAIALARRFPEAEVHAVDVSRDALDVARLNAERLAVDVTFHRGDLIEALPERLVGSVDLLVSNPPYVAAHEWSELPEDVKREPREALVAGPEGTEALAAIAAGADRWLAPGAVVACEIGERQSAVLVPMFSRLGAVEVHRDLAGRERYLLVTKP